MNETTARLRQMERILEISHELTSTVSLERLLHRIVEAAAELTDCESAAILLQGDDPNKLRFVVASTFADQLADIPVPVESSIAGAAFESGEAIVVSDAQADPRYYREIERQIGFAARSLLAVPLQFRERRIGVLEAENKRSEAGFDQQDVEILSTLAAQATVSIENARLVEALHQNQNQLERRVEERTAKLQAHNEELDAFAQTVAHNLQNPLASVIGFLSMLVRDYASMPPQELEEALNVTLRSARKVNSIIEELLLLSSVRKMEQVATAPLDTGRIVAAVQERLAGLIAQYEAEMVVPDPTAWPRAWGYGPWVEEVWANYVSNAIKYGARPPRVALGADESQGGQVRFWVRDNGPGLTPDEQGRLFVPFTQLHQVRAKGHGLGLSIVRRIVEKLGGQVGVESPGGRGQGSLFFFSLPAVPD